MFASAVSAALLATGAAAALPATPDPAATRAALEALEKTPWNVIPAGVTCDEATVCDKYGYCSIVCARGSVEVDPWLAGALATQQKLADNDELCYAFMPGTHNSGITQADGYGNEDQVWNVLIDLVDKFVPWAFVQTNDQHLSLTDQMNLGVRLVELDTHYFLGDLRIAHCGGFELQKVDWLIDALNKVAELFGLEIRWDTDTIGCDPSLSGIPAADQRTLADALAEIVDWQAANPGEFLMLFLDDEEDLAQWGQTGPLLDAFNAAFDNATIFTPADKDAYSAGATDWPTIGEIKAMGKSVLVMSGADLGDEMTSLIFHKSGPRLCDWGEPHSSFIDAFPNCTATSGDTVTMTGRYIRPESSEIQYGPLNAGGGWGVDDNILNETSIPPQVACGANSPSPDLLTPERAATFVWSWAQGEPAFDGGCAKLSAATGRWHAEDCAAQLPAACRIADEPYRIDNWAFSEPGAGDADVVCAQGMEFLAPNNGWQNSALLQAMGEAGVEEAWVNYS